MMGYGFGMGWLWMIVPLIGLILLVGLGIWAIMATLNGANQRSKTANGAGSVAQVQTPEEILRQRFARGEISAEQYNEMRQTLLVQ